MKRIASPPEPEALANFRSTNPTGTWQEFKNTIGNESVFDALAAAQGYLCAYCEIEIQRALKGQVEHWEPKSASTTTRNLHLAFSNLLAACEGGTNPHLRGRSENPIGQTQHCGALKGDQSPAGRMLDPRSLPEKPSIWHVDHAGRMSVDTAACQASQVDSGLAASTLEFLGLNRRVLARLRQTLLEELDKELKDVGDGELAKQILSIASRELSSDAQGRLRPFWSTVRAWCHPWGETVILPSTT